MLHDPALAKTAAEADPRPVSAVSTGVGLAGLAGLLAWCAVAKWFGMAGPLAALTNVIACGVPMVLWSVLVDKVHRRPSTGIDWARTPPLKDTIDTSLTKLAGLWATWALIAAIYATGRFYWRGNFLFAMEVFTVVAPVLFAASIPYVIWFDRKLIEPRDGAWHLGAWLMNLEGAEPEMIYAHLRAWGVKAFFLAFMLAIVPPGFADFVRADTHLLLSNPVALANWLITFMFVIDVAFATVGYVLTMRALDSHIRSANPYAAAWMAALICYPPFVLMGDGGPLDYHPGTADWTHWLAGEPILLWLFGAMLVALTAIYAWATVAFGFRFSNLTHRGILTHGPYRFSRHPAYLSKNLFWWLSTLPWFTTGSVVDAMRATVLMGVVSGIYYWRAKTEERHLSADPDYQAYWHWMERNGAVPRFFAFVLGRQL
ncbi:MAG: methyltransferase family protein [Sphingomonas sp.]